MSRWDPGDKKLILQQIADDVRRPDNEREAARRELLPPAQASPRRGRNSNTPQTQQDQDADIENSFRCNDRLTTRDRIEIERSLDESTQQILRALGNRILWLFSDNLSEVELMISLHRRTQSDFVRGKALEAIQHIASYSTIQAAKSQAQEFLCELDLNPPQTRKGITT